MDDKLLDSVVDNTTSTSTENIQNQTSTSTTEVESKLDVKKLDDDLLSKITSLIEEKLKNISSPKTNSDNDIAKLVEKQVNDRLGKIEYDMFMNGLREDESELIKSIPDYNKLTIQQLKAIVTKSSSLPKLNPKVGGVKEETLDEMAKRARGGK